MYEPVKGACPDNSNHCLLFLADYQERHFAGKSWVREPYQTPVTVCGSSSSQNISTNSEHEVNAAAETTLGGATLGGATLGGATAPAGLRRRKTFLGGGD